MGTLDEAVKRLEHLIETGSADRAPEIRIVLGALSEAREVLAGADHTAAKYWRRMTEAERERDEAREARFLEREESNITYQQRDELAAVIERVRAEVGHNSPPSRIERILNSVPADVLRERDADRWKEGATFAWEQSGEGWNGEYPGAGESPDWDEKCPYRETKGQD